jgi:hypothetical protein
MTGRLRRRSFARHHGRHYAGTLCRGRILGGFVSRVASRARRRRSGRLGGGLSGGVLCGFHEREARKKHQHAHYNKKHPQSGARHARIRSESLYTLHLRHSSS